MLGHQLSRGQYERGGASCLVPWTRRIGLEIDTNQSLPTTLRYNDVGCAKLRVDTLGTAN
jgi:hypothetical protein